MPTLPSYMAYFADSTETPSISNAMMKPISPQIILDPKPTTLTAMSNLNLKNAMLANNETNMANKMIGVDAKNEDKETYSD